MPTLSQLRRRIDALKRKYARELAVVRLRPLAQEFTLSWACAVYQRRPAPNPQPFIRRVVQHGFRLPTFMALHNYLERCRSEGIIPDSFGIIAILLPQVPCDRLRHMLRWDYPARSSDYPSFLCPNLIPFPDPRGAIALWPTPQPCQPPSPNAKLNSIHSLATSFGPAHLNL